MTIRKTKQKTNKQQKQTFDFEPKFREIIVNELDAHIFHLKF